MDKQAVIRSLESLGLSNYEAKAYLAILSEHPITGYKLSKISGVPRSRIYEAIEKLAAKGLVVMQTGEIVLLKPVSVEAFLEKKEKENQQNINFLRNELHGVAEVSKDQGIWNISGREKIIELMEVYISQAKKYLYVLGSSDDLILLEESFAKADKRNVKIHGVYWGEKSLPRDYVLRHRECYCTSCREVALILDSKFALVGSTFPPELAVAALTENLGIIYIIKEYLKQEIFFSKLFDASEPANPAQLKKLHRQVMNELP